MVCVFAPWRNEEADWTALLPGWTLAALPIAGRPLIEHQLDWAAGQGATEVVVLDYGYDVRLNEILTGGDRRRWPFKLSYRRTPPMAGEEEVRLWFAENESEIAIDRIIVGPDFPYGNGFRPIETLADYARINFDVIADPRDRTPSGYSSESGVYLGMNVAIKTGCPIVRPICLGDDVLIDFGCRLNGRVIVGDKSIIDREAALEESIVFPGTYIGVKMDLRRKIVCGNRVIDIDTGEWVDIEELGLCGYIEGSGIRRSFLRLIRGLFGGKSREANRVG